MGGLALLTTRGGDKTTKKKKGRLLSPLFAVNTVIFLHCSPENNNTNITGLVRVPDGPCVEYGDAR